MMRNATDGLISARLVPLVLPALVLLAAACSQSPKTPVEQDARATSPDAARDSLSADVAQADRTVAVDQPVSPDSAGDLTTPDSTTDMLPSPDMDPFPVGRFGCMGTLVGGLSQLGQVGNVRVFSGCGGPSEYLLVWGGGVGNLTQTDLSTVKDAKSDELLGLDGVWGHGISNCCAASTNDACISLYVSTNSATAWEVAGELDNIFAGETECFAVMANIPGPASPRCEAGCAPIPICGGSTGDPVCCAAPPWNPAADRTPTLEHGQPLFDLELPQNAGECTHDGECVLNGCGNHCVAYTAPSSIAICPCYSALNKSFCGCVDGVCVWYEQK